MASETGSLTRKKSYPADLDSLAGNPGLNTLPQVKFNFSQTFEPLRNAPTSKPASVVQISHIASQNIPKPSSPTPLRNKAIILQQDSQTNP
jgi:hypothetical protein